MNLSEMYKGFDDLMRRHNEYVVYEKPLAEMNNGKIVSGSKYIVIAPAAVLDQLEKELSEKYDTAIELLSKYDKNRAVRVSSQTGCSYRLNYYDHEKDKRSHVSINNLVMIDSEIPSVSLEHTARRKKEMIRNNR